MFVVFCYCAHFRGRTECTCRPDCSACCVYGVDAHDITQKPGQALRHQRYVEIFAVTSAAHMTGYSACIERADQMLGAQCTSTSTSMLHTRIALSPSSACLHPVHGFSTILYCCTIRRHRLPDHAHMMAVHTVADAQLTPSQLTPVSSLHRAQVTIIMTISSMLCNANLVMSVHTGDPSLVHALCEHATVPPSVFTNSPA